MTEASRIAIRRAPPPPIAWGMLSERSWRIGLVLLVLATFLIRARYFGNPLIDVDEEFYLLTGDRMLHGAIPYLDIWDRKPVGLFLLYAAIRLLGGDGILQYQLVATGFAAATAVMIAILARRITTERTALLAGLLYVPALAMSGGQGGQTPVFYNLPMIVAAWAVLRLAAPLDRRPSPRAIRWQGAGAMLLVGLALQIKYSALFEGMFFGLALLWIGWRRDPRLRARAGDAALWIAAALAPTLLAFACYAAIGAAQPFVYANFTSILARSSISAGHQFHDLKRIVVRMLPFAIPILIGEWLLRSFAPWRTRAGGPAAHLFLCGWLIAAILGVAAFGTFFNHYALPLLPPLAIVAAPAFAIRHRFAGPIVAGLVLLVFAIAYPLDAAKYARRRGDAAHAHALVAAIAPRLHGRCLYVFYGDPILYQLSGSCLPTAWVFPFHLSLERDAPAIGVDPEAEVRRILANPPPVIVDTAAVDDEINPRTAAIVHAALAADYRSVGTFPTDSGRGTIVYARRADR